MELLKKSVCETQEGRDILEQQLRCEKEKTVCLIERRKLQKRQYDWLSGRLVEHWRLRCETEAHVKALKEDLQGAENASKMRAPLVHFARGGPTGTLLDELHLISAAGPGLVDRFLDQSQDFYASGM